MRTTRTDHVLTWAVGAACAVAILTGAHQAVAAEAAPVAVPGATITAESWVTTRTLELTISTPSFDRPELVEVTLPVGYGDEPSTRWPVTYYLHGTNHDQTTFRSYGGEALTTGYPSLVVTPDGDAGYWSDWYGNGLGNAPQYETFVTDQLIPLIDANFRTLNDRAHRLIMGESMGGWGVLMTTARHPDLFAAAASLSGVLDSSSSLAAAAISASPVLSGGLPNAIYGPYATQQVRWRGHDPVELADNLRDVDLQVITGNGVYDPSHGETAEEGAACPALEGLVIHPTSIAMHQRLLALKIPHRWVELNWGCHSVTEFNYEIALALQRFQHVLTYPVAPPATFDFRSVEPSFGLWGWTVRADPRRALEFFSMQRTDVHGVTLTGSGTTVVTTAPLFAGLRTVQVSFGSINTTVQPDAAGRLTFSVDLGPADTQQQYTVGAVSRWTTINVRFSCVTQPS